MPDLTVDGEVCNLRINQQIRGMIKTSGPLVENREVQR